MNVNSLSVGISNMWRIISVVGRSPADREVPGSNHTLA